MKPFDGRALGQAVVAHVRGYMAKAVGELSAKMVLLEERIKAIPAGEKGEKGDIGESIKGDIGPAGADGTCFISGEGPPEISIGKSGDHYMDVLTGDVYRCD